MNDIPRLKLIEIIAQYGKSVIDDPRRLKGLLLDSCGEYKREIHSLMDASYERVPLDLRDASGSMPPTLLIANLTQRLLNKRPMAENMARWAVETWAIALGVIPQPVVSRSTGVPPALVQQPKPKVVHAGVQPVQVQLKSIRPAGWFWWIGLSGAILVIVLIFSAVYGNGQWRFMVAPTVTLLPTLQPTLTSVPIMLPTLEQTITSAPTPLPPPKSTLTSAPTTLPTVTRTATIHPSPTPIYGLVNAGTLGGAIVRPDPGSISIMATLLNGSIVEFLPEVVNKNGFVWIHIRTPDGKEGWVQAGMIVTVTPLPHR